jgi:lactate permease
MTWAQNYIPLGDLRLSALVAALPAALLLGLLGILHVRVHRAALIGLGAALILAIGVYGMPAPLALVAALNGAAYGLFPIGWIVLGAIFVYDIAVQSGTFDQVKQMMAGISADRRIQTLLIAFSFGAFIEGAAGFGTPVAISAAMLIGLGFAPLPAAGLALIGNTAPVPYAALGTPLIALASVTGLPLNELSAMVGRQLAPFSLLIPFWLVWALSGWRGLKGVWPACLVCGFSFAGVQLLVSNLHGPWMVALASALASIAALIAFLRFWQPAEVWRFPHERGAAPVDGEAADPPLSRSRALRAWLPWIILSLFVFVWGLPPVKAWLNSVGMARIEVPLLHEAVLRVPPVVVQPEPEPAIFVFNWLSATGTSLLLAGVVAGLALGQGPRALIRLFLGTLRRVRFSLLTIAAMLALGYTTRYAGIDTTMGLAFAATGVLFPFFSPLLGWFGVVVTGSDTSSNVLFGNLQKVTAQSLGISPVLAAAANSSGGVMGKMIDAQSIVVASVATGQRGHEGDILRYVFFHSVALAALVGVVVMIQVYYGVGG